MAFAAVYQVKLCKNKIRDFGEIGKCWREERKEGMSAVCLFQCVERSSSFRVYCKGDQYIAAILLFQKEGVPKILRFVRLARHELAASWTQRRKFFLNFSAPYRGGATETHPFRNSPSRCFRAFEFSLWSKMWSNPKAPRKAAPSGERFSF